MINSKLILAYLKVNSSSHSKTNKSMRMHSSEGQSAHNANWQKKLHKPDNSQHEIYSIRFAKAHSKIFISGAATTNIWLIISYSSYFVNSSHSKHQLKELRLNVNVYEKLVHSHICMVALSLWGYVGGQVQLPVISIRKCHLYNVNF